MVLRGLSKQELQTWAKHRIQAKHLLENPHFELVLSAVILLNLALMVIETDMNQLTGRIPEWMQALNNGLLGAFLIELALRIYVYRARFFHDPMCIIDALVVGLDLVSTMLEALLGGMGGLSILRILRLLRLSRATLIVEKVPELSMLARSLIGALKPIFWGSIIVVFLLAAWGVLAVQFIHPLNEEVTNQGFYAEQGCERCPRAYQTVWHSSLTMIQQIIAGDAWGMVTLPIIEQYPASGIFFILMFISLEVALMNVVLACVVDSAAQARVDDLSGDGVQKKLEEFFQDLDMDRSGAISFDELKHGFASNKEFKRRMAKMDVNEGDIDAVWDILDSDKSGMIQTGEFVSELARLKRSNPHTMLIMIQHYVGQIRDKINEQLKVMMVDLEEAEKKETIMMEKMQAEEQELSANVSRLVEKSESQATPQAQISGDHHGAQGSIQASLMSNDPTDVPEIKLNAKASLYDSPFIEEQQRFMADLRASAEEIKRKLDICMGSFGGCASHDASMVQDATGGAGPINAPFSAAYNPGPIAAPYAAATYNPMAIRITPLENSVMQMPSTKPGLPLALCPMSRCSVQKRDEAISAISADPPIQLPTRQPLLPGTISSPNRPR